MPRQAKKTKAEETAELVAAAVGAGRKLKLPSVDFSDPNRPKTCLEVDFPILPINQIAQIEGNARKPVYDMGKWWAWRRSSIFRAMLIAAATKAPDDPMEAAKTVWDAYYGNHQDNEAFHNLKVADIFMGGGTTLVEGSRLGMQMFGNDLNPVAWFVVKNRLAEVDLDEVEKLFDHIEREVKPQIMPFYACEGPGGERGTWTHRPTGEVMDEDFDPLALSPEERKDYSYEGPEVIYTFWAKHGPCPAPGCGHRTPLFTSSVVAIKTLSVKTWFGFECRECGDAFDVERAAARMAPDMPLVIAKGEAPFAVMDTAGRFACPHCGKEHRDEVTAEKGYSSLLPKAGWKNKNISLSLLIHPDWMRGASGKAKDGAELGGSVRSTVEASCRWYEVRANTAGLIEIRGNLDGNLYIPEFDAVLDPAARTSPRDAWFECQSCGLQTKTLIALMKTQGSAPYAAHTLQCYSPSLNASGDPYGGRYYRAFGNDDVARLVAACREWSVRKSTDLKPYFPDQPIPFGLKAHIKDPLPKHGYTLWQQLFNPRQLLLHALIFKAIDNAHGFSRAARDEVILSAQQYLAYQNMFSFWHRSKDHFAPFLSNNNLNQKNGSIEVGAFVPVGYGPWRSARAPIIEGLRWHQNPWDLAATDRVLQDEPALSDVLKTKSSKVYPGDRVSHTVQLTQASSTALESFDDESVDLVVTDPPFSGLYQYAEFSDFFYVWTRILLRRCYPDSFDADFSPKALEAVANEARNPDDSNEFYKRVLTQCWAECARVLKKSGLLAFTFHHSEDEPWVDVLDSLFSAGFYLEATYPVRSDETKGDDAQFGAQKVEFDIVHVCRKRMYEPTAISWARLRRRILADVRQLQNLLEHHQREGLPAADIQVIKRGKALEYFSRHYGKVYIEQGREFTVKEALVGINQLLDEEHEGDIGVPIHCEPLTRQFLRIFAGQAEVPRDQMQKFLRGSGMAPSDFIERGWCFEKSKRFYWVSAVEFAQAKVDKAGTLHRDLDQALLLIGAFHADSGVPVKRILSDDFRAHPALADLLSWLMHHHPDDQARSAAISARTRYLSWAAEHQSTVAEQLSLFDLLDEAS